SARAERGRVLVRASARSAHLCWSQRLRRPEKNESFAVRVGEFWLARVCCRSALLRTQVAAWVHPELGMVDRRSHAHSEYAAFPAAHLRLQNHVQNAARRSRNQGHPGKIQEIFHARSAQSGDEQGSDGHLQPRGNQSRRWL